MKPASDKTPVNAESVEERLLREAKERYEKRREDAGDNWWEKLLEELKDIPDGDLYHALLNNDFKEFKKLALERYMNAFPDQFALDKCKSGKNIITAIVNLKKPAEDKKEGCTFSNLIRSYGKLIESAYLIMAKSSEFRVVVGHSSSSGDYETTITRCGEDAFQTEELMTYWN